MEPLEGGIVDGPYTRWPERVLACGLLLGTVSAFLPWWQYTVNPLYQYFYLATFPGGDVVSNGFNGWGILYILSLGVSAGVLTLRALGPGEVAYLDLPVRDWFVYGVCTALMVISLLAVWVSLPINPAVIRHEGLRYGWWTAVVAAALVLSGSLLLKAET